MNEPVLKTLLFTDLVDSTRLVDRLGDRRAAEVFARHHLLARELLKRHHGREVDNSDGFFLLFGRTIHAVEYALAYHEGLRRLSAELEVSLTARVGVHVGEVILRENPADAVEMGAKPFEVEGLAKVVASRLMSLAAGRQTLLSRTACEMARRGARDGATEGASLEWQSYGPYALKGVVDPVEVFEVGIVGLSVLAPPADSAKAQPTAPVPIVSRTTATSGRSELALRLVLPEGGSELVLEDESGWRRTRDPGSLPEAWRTTALRRRLRNQEPRPLLDEAGNALGAWLFDRETRELLATRVASHEDGGSPLRLELHTGDAWAGWPWELARLPGLGSLGVHPVLTVVRHPVFIKGGISTSISADHGTSTAPMLSVEVVGTPDREDLDQVRREIEAAGEHGRLAVRLDALGDFAALARRYGVSGPPHVIHFDAARSLPFPSADELADLLKGTAHEDRCTQLVCLRTQEGTAALAHRLVRLGVPLAAGWDDDRSGHESRTMVAAFYRSLAGGEAIDVAVQTARRRLCEAGGIAWAFATLHAHDPCRPLLRPADGVWRPSAEILDFGHEVPRHRMQRFLKRRHPMVVIIHGEAHTGHRHVARRVQHDLERAGNVLWRPMATLRWFVAGEPRLSRSQLAGGIATALDVSDRGTQEELEGRIARVIAERTADERVLVIDLVEVVTLADESQAEALLTLIHTLWTDVMDRAADYRTALPVYLLLSVAYPKPLPGGHRGARRVRKRIDLARKTIEKIAARPRLQGRIRVEVLPELEPIGEDYVADFLEEVLEIDPDDAQRRAQHLVGLEDNETILERMERLLEEWRTYE